MGRKDWTRSAWVENDWMHQGARRWQKGEGGSPGWRQGPSRRVVKEARRAGDWVLMALLVIVWAGVVTAPLWMK